MADGIAISVVLPEKRGASLGRAKPKGCVSLQDGPSSQRIYVPAIVARTLKKLLDDDGIRASSFSQFRQQLDDLSRDCAWKRLLGLIDRRAYSRAEVLAKLKDDGFSVQVCETAVDRACECHLIDDARYGEVYVRGKVYAGWGRERIQRELSRKGIDAESIPGWPDEFFSDEQDFERALAIASRKHLTGKNDFQKIMRLLASKGYSPSIAYRVAAVVADNTQTDEQ